MSWLMSKKFWDKKLAGLPEKDKAVICADLGLIHLFYHGACRIFMSKQFAETEKAKRVIRLIARKLYRLEYYTPPAVYGGCCLDEGDKSIGCCDDIDRFIKWHKELTFRHLAYEDEVYIIEKFNISEELTIHYRDKME